MEIKNNINSPYFEAKLNTASVLETTSLKIFHNEGIAGFKEVAHALTATPIKATGNKGYKYYAELFGKQIMEKYPQIAEATRQINEIVKKNPNIKKDELNNLVQPIIEKIGTQIDITL